MAQHLLQRVEHLDADAEPLGEGLRADRHHHELLRVHVVGRVGAAVQDVHHRHGQHPRHGAAEVAVERQAAILRRGAGHRQRHAEDGVGAELALVGRAVGVHHLGVDRDLVGRGHSLQPGPEHLVHVAHGLDDALAHVAARVAVAQLHGLVLAGRRAAGHGRAALGAARQHHLGLDGGIAAAVEDLAGVHFNDRAHDGSG